MEQRVTARRSRGRDKARRGGARRAGQGKAGESVEGHGVFRRAAPGQGLRTGAGRGEARLGRAQCGAGTQDAAVHHR